MVISNNFQGYGSQVELKTGSSVIFLFAKETVVRRQWETLCDGNTKGRVSHFVGECENPSFHQNSGYYGYQQSQWVIFHCIVPLASSAYM